MAAIASTPLGRAMTTGIPRRINLLCNRLLLATYLAEAHRITAPDVARVAVESAEVRLKKLTISAPFSGTLGFRAVSEGAYVTAGTPLVQLDKVDRLQVSFSVPELQQQAMAQAESVELVADALLGESFIASVSALNPSIDVNGRALQVRAALDNTAMKLRPGLLVRVTVKGPPRDAVMIPEAAVVQRGQGALVYVVNENKVKEVRVSLGKRMEGKVEVKEGIAAGDVASALQEAENGSSITTGQVIKDLIKKKRGFKSKILTCSNK